MNREDFIDLLRDYLKMYFPSGEIEEMIWDYEEYFDAGLASGKTEAEIIASLGSPKKIAKDLAEELSMRNAEESSSNLKNKAKLYGMKSKSAIKNGYHNSKKKVTEFLSDENKGTLNEIGKFLLKMLLLLIVIVLGFYVLMGALMLLPITIVLIAAIIIAIVVSIMFVPVNIPTAAVFFFGALLLIGIAMIGFEALRLLARFIKTSYQRFKTWWKYRLNGGASHE